MRLAPLSALFTVVAVIASGVAAHQEDTLSARELGLNAELSDLSARDILSELSTRELLDELNDRLEARQTYMCLYCGRRFTSAVQLMFHRKQAHNK